MLATHHPKRHLLSFKYAFEGVYFVLKSQANFRLHLLIAVLICLLAAMLNFSIIEWIVVILTIAFILCLEMINTVFEVLVDHLWQEEHPRAKVIKDVGAGVVLIGAIAAAIVGSLLFLPHLLAFFRLP